jgi:hypothetical protein
MTTNTLWVYGDSYTALEEGWEAPWWTTGVARNLNLSQNNRAVSGGSNETIFRRFYYDMPNHQPGDVIICQMSTGGRLHLEFQVDRPETAAPYLHPVDTSAPEHSWYKDNQHHIEWLLTSSDPMMHTLNLEAYVGVLANYARARPDITVVVLRNDIQRQSFPIVRASNYLESKESLFAISRDEYPTRVTYVDWVKYIKYDVRANHLSDPNHHIMADSITAMIIHRDPSILKADRFVRGNMPIIKNRDDYLTLVESRQLTYNPSRFGNIPL